MKLRDDILKYTKKKILYQPIPHPCFNDWKVSRPSRATLKLITQKCGSVKRKKILDIGCFYGFYSHILAKQGAIVTAIDIHPTRIAFCRRLSKLYGLTRNNPKFLIIDFMDFMSTIKEKFDIVIFLNTLHHIIKQHGASTWLAMEKLADHTDTLFLSYDGLDAGEIIRKTSFISATHLGRPAKGSSIGGARPLYAFDKPLKIQVGKLWDNSYRKKGVISMLGKLHHATAKKILLEPSIPVKRLPLYKYMISDAHKAQGKTRKRVIKYLNEYKSICNSLRREGYRPSSRRPHIRVFLEKGKYKLRDGNKRLNCLLVLGHVTTEIEVFVDRRF